MSTSSLQDQYLKQMLDLPYPFNAIDSSLANLRELVADIYVRLPSGTEFNTVYVSDYSVNTDTGGADAYAFHITIKGNVDGASTTWDTSTANWSNVDPVMDGSYDYTDADFDGWRNIYWAFNDGTRIQIIINIEKLQSIAGTSGSGSAYMTARVVDIEAKSLQSLTFDDAVSGTEFTLNGDILLVPGTNMGYLHSKGDDIGILQTQNIEMYSAPGIGDGKYYDTTNCDELDTYLFTLNGVQPDADGNINITGDECLRIYSLQSPDSGINMGNVGTITGNDPVVWVDQQCDQCLDCSDINSLYTTLTDVQTKLAEYRDKMYDDSTSTSLVTQYNNLVNDINGIMAEIKSKTAPTLSTFRSADSTYAFKILFHAGTDGGADWCNIKVGPIIMDTTGGGDLLNITLSYVDYSAYVKRPGEKMTALQDFGNAMGSSGTAQLLTSATNTCVEQCSALWAQFALVATWDDTAAPTVGWDTDITVPVDVTYSYDVNGMTQSATITVSLLMKFQDPTA